MAIILMDLEGQIVDWSDAAADMTGLDTTTTLGKHFSALHSKYTEPITRAKAELEQALQREHYEGGGLQMGRGQSRCQGPVVLWEFRVPKLGRVGYVIVLHDLTSETELEASVVKREAALAASLAEREVLLQEVHHRVKNNLQVIVSLINMQIRACSDPGSQRALQECASRVQAMALIHEKLYQSSDYSRIPFYDYVESLSKSVFLASGVTRGQVELQLSVERLPLRVDRAIPCGLLLNELLSNALKHGFSSDQRGHVEIVLRREGTELTLAVINDGKPLPQHFDVHNQKSLGAQLILTLTEQLEGRLRVESEPLTAFRVSFPHEVEP